MIFSPPVRRMIAGGTESCQNSQMLLWLRRIASCFFLTLAILFASLWVRSCWCWDTLILDAKSHHFDITSLRGLLSLHWNSFGSEYLSYNSARNVIPLSDVPPLLFNLPNFSFDLGPQQWYVIIPHWFPVAALAVIAIAIRPAPRFKFNLRDLFTLTTVAALVIGPFAFWLRSIG